MKEDLKNQIIGKQASPTYTEILSQDGNAKRSAAFMATKGGTGQVVSYITFHALCRRYGITLNTHRKIHNADGTVTLIPLEIPFKGMEGKYDMNSEFDSNNREKTTVFSAFTTSQVDAIKNPYAIDMAIINETIDILAYLELRGLGAEEQMWLVQQPILQKYFKELSIRNSMVMKSLTFSPEKIRKSEAKIVANIKNHYTKGGAAVNKLSVELLKAEKNNPTKAQQYILDAWLEFKEQARVISKLKKYVSVDTKYLNNKDDVKSHMSVVEDIRESGMIKNYDVLLAEGSILHPFAVGRSMQYELFKDMYLSEHPKVVAELDYIKNQIGATLYSEAEKSKLYSTIDSFFVVYLLQKHQLSEDEGRANYLSQDYFDYVYFGGRYEVDGEVVVVDSLPEEIRKIQIDTSHPLNGNPAIQAFVPVPNSKVKIGNKKIMNLRLKDSSLPAMTVNNLEEAMNEIHQQDPLLYERLVAFNLFQSGIGNSPYQFQKILPAKFLRTLLAEAGKVVETVDVDMDDFFHTFLRAKLKYTKDYNVQMTTGTEAALPVYNVTRNGRKIPVDLNGKELPLAGDSIYWVNVNNTEMSAADTRPAPMEDDDLSSQQTDPTDEMFDTLRSLCCKNSYCKETNY